VKKASGPIHIDASLDEPAWQEAAPIPIAHEWFPGDNIPSAVKTDVLVTWDDDKLYVAFRAADPLPRNIRARYAERDAILNDDTVGFLVDPFNDDRRAYQFRVNPLGVQADAINSDVEGSEDFDWDAIWDSAGRITSDGYVVEMAIPLQQLRIPAGGGPRTWGFLAMRDWPRDVRHRFRSVVTDQNRNCLICQFADLSGFGTTDAGRNLEVTPTLTGRMQQARDFGSNFETVDDGIEPGVSARWAVTSGTSLQGTLNPDFSQVEADAAQLDVNTRFAISYPEKRPFFLEGSDFFETQLPLVFTRTIADPTAGLKLTGKSGPHAYGVVLARDRINNLILPSDESSRRVTLDSDTTAAVVRYRRELGKSATAGVLVSSRTGDDYSNTVVSADSFFRISEQDTVRVQVAGSDTNYPVAVSAEDPSGHALYARYSHNDRNWSWGGDYGEHGTGFRADVGLFNQVGIRAGSGFAERRIRGGPERWFRNIFVFAGMDATRQIDGQWTEWGGDFGATFEGSRQSSVDFNLAPNQEYFAGRTYNNFRQSVSGSIQATRDLHVGLFLNWGESIDFSNARPADFYTIEPSATFDIGARIHGELSHVHQVFKTEDGAHIFTVDLPQARLLYHFDRRTFLRAILQYQNVRYSDPVRAEESEFLSQLLFSYRINAQTVFLLGYSDNYLGDQQVDLTQTDRTFFAKLSYAFLF
jgi:hypothetical protein